MTIRDKVSKIIQCRFIFLIITYQHNKGYNMVSEACRGSMFPSQIQSLLTSALLWYLKWIRNENDIQQFLTNFLSCYFEQKISMCLLSNLFWYSKCLMLTWMYFYKIFQPRGTKFYFKIEYTINFKSLTCTGFYNE